MQKKYNLSTIARGLLLAPIPILFALFIYALITEPSLSNNYENNSYLRFLTTVTLAAYIIYIFIIWPILFLTLYLINKYKFINLYTLVSTAYLYGVFLSILGSYLKDNDFPNTLIELKMLLILNPIFIFTGSTALCFWLFLKCRH